GIAMSRFLHPSRVLSCACLFVVVGAATVSATTIDVAFRDNVTGFNWAQLSETVHTSLTTMMGICTPVCSGNINGYNMDGWTWATVAEADRMWIDLLASPPTLPFPGIGVLRMSADWKPKLKAAFQPTYDFEHVLTGWSGFTSDRTADGE